MSINQAFLLKITICVCSAFIASTVKIKHRHCPKFQGNACIILKSLAGVDKRKVDMALLYVYVDGRAGFRPNCVIVVT